MLRRIRQAFVAPVGRTLVAADYSQIELRIMAHLSADVGLRRAFSEGLDVHRATASEVFGVPLDAVTADQRRSSKAINFGLIYGMSAFGLGRQLGVSRTVANEYIERYFARYPGVRNYMDGVRAEAAKLQPVLIGRDGVDGRAEIAEAVEEAVADVPPVAELYADLEGGHRLAHEIGFVDAEPVVEDVDRGQRRLAWMLEHDARVLLFAEHIPDCLPERARALCPLAVRFHVLRVRHHAPVIELTAIDHANRAVLLAITAAVRAGASKRTIDSTNKILGNDNHDAQDSLAPHAVLGRISRFGRIRGRPAQERKIFRPLRLDLHRASAEARFG